MPAMTDEPQIAQVADRARILARDISKNVGRILAALQIGDISRQRAEHVQTGLGILDGLDPSRRQLRLRAAGEMLLAAQLEAALRDHNQAVSRLLPGIEGLASDALALAALSDVLTELGDNGHDLSDLKRRMDAAVQLVAEIQAADGAVRYLAGRLSNDKGPIVSGVSPLSLERHPLDQKACELLDRAIYLEAAADDCVVILERLKDASEALMTDPPATDKTAAVSPSAVSPVSQKALAAAAERIKAILEKAGDDIAVHAGKNTDILRLLDRSANPLAIDGEADGELEAGSYAGLNFTSPDPGPDDGAFESELSGLLSKIERLYTMGQERDIQRAFSRACGLETKEDPDATEDGLF
jgi:hypothetical protein